MFEILIILIILNSLSACTNENSWKKVWSDEFKKARLNNSKWTFDLGNGGNNPGWGNNEKEYYTESKKNVTIEKGMLKISAIEEPDSFNGFKYTSARIKTMGLFSKKYGKFEIKAKLPVGKGLWPAIWLLPEENVYGTWAASGEIDIMEAKGSIKNKTSGAIHFGGKWPNNTFLFKEYSFPDNGSIEDFHVYSLEWEPNEIRWYVDGNLFQTQKNWYTKKEDSNEYYKYPAPFDQKFHILINLAVGGNFDGDPDEKTVFPASMLIDYVRVYDKIK